MTTKRGDAVPSEPINGGHVNEKFRHLLGLSKEERIAFLDGPRWIGYDQAKKVMDELERLMRIPKQPRMPNLLIVGDSNNGKTTIIDRFMDANGKGYVDENVDPVKPAVVVQSPPKADEKALYLAILESFYVPYRPTDPANKLRYQVIHLFRECRTKLLIIDEFHSLLTGTAIKQREVMNVLKMLCNELSIPIVGFGTRDAVRVLHTDPQHASRFDVIPLPTWDLNVDFQKLLRGFESVLPLKRPSNLYHPQIAPLLHSICGGNLGDLRRLITACAKQAISSETECITKDIIEQNSWIRPTKGLRERKL